MNASQLQDCIGKTEDSPEIKKVLAELGVTKKLRPNDDGDAWVKRPDLGLTLVFAPVERKSSIFKLLEATLYSSAEQGFENFAGELPGDVSFDDPPATVRKKLGKPTKEIKPSRVEIWVSGERRVTIQYRKSKDGIASIALGEPL